jgi:galactose mutarotase-like enzyme
MNIVESREGQLTVYKLDNSDGRSSLKVVPERGGIITELKLLERDILSLNKATLVNIEENVRGGIPILFPISGQLQNGEYEFDGQVYQMRNHGVARNYPWEVLEMKDGEGLSISLTFRACNHPEFVSFC